MMKSIRVYVLRTVGMLALGMLAGASAGCLRLNVMIDIHEDGSATVTESLVLTKRLLELEKTHKNLAISSFLQRAAAEKRMAGMGSGVSLASHKISDAPAGGKQSVSVFKVGNLEDLKYVSPFLAYQDYPTNNTLRFKYTHRLEAHWTGRPPGTVGVQYNLEKRGQGVSTNQESQEKWQKSRPAPAVLQEYRTLAPMFKDLLKDFEVRITLRPYARIEWSGVGLRDRVKGTNRLDILHFNDKTLDAQGQNFLDNEEIMVELLQYSFMSQNIVRNAGVWSGNKTVPVLITSGSPFSQYLRGSDFFFKPSRHFFDKYFKGKKILWAYKTQPKPAVFEKMKGVPFKAKK